MDLPLYSILPGIAALGLIGFTTAQIAAGRGATVSWMVPALLSIGFLGWSLHAVAVGGPLGFWTEHIRNAWGNQIWFDLLLAVGMAWTLLLPRARAAGMRPLPWLVLILCTGSIGLCAMVARCLFLESRAPGAATLQPRGAL